MYETSFCQIECTKPCSPALADSSRPILSPAWDLHWLNVTMFTGLQYKKQKKKILFIATVATESSIFISFMYGLRSFHFHVGCDNIFGAWAALLLAPLSILYTSRAYRKILVIGKWLSNCSEQNVRLPIRLMPKLILALRVSSAE